MESWIEVIDGYKVSNLGEVYSTKTNKILKKHTDRYGYLYVGVYIDGKLKFKKVHRLVAKAFLSNYSDNLQVNHKNEDKKDNRVENLEMCNNRYNCNYGSRKNVLSKAVIQETLDGNFVKEWASTREIEQTLGFSNASISACCRGFAKDYHSGKVYPVHKAFGYKWKYKNNE